MTTVQRVLIAAVNVRCVLQHLHVLSVILHIILRLGIALACKGLMIMELLVLGAVINVQHVRETHLVLNAICHTLLTMVIATVRQEPMTIVLLAYLAIAIAQTVLTRPLALIVI